MIKVKWLGSEVRTYSTGLTLNSGNEYLIPNSELPRWGNASDVLADVLLFTLRVYDHQGVEAADGPTAVDLLKDNMVKKVLPTVGPSGGYSLRPRGFNGVAVKQTVTNLDFELDADIALRGGILEAVLCTPGDWIKVLIVDVNNILGYGANFVVKEYIQKWFVMKGQNRLEDVDVSDPIPQGLIVRVEYHSDASATEDTPVCMNLLAYELD